MQSRRPLWLFIIVLILVTLFVVKHRHGVVARLHHLVLGAHPAARVLVGVGQSLPSFQLTSLAGKRTSVIPKPGRILYLNVFTTWCPECVKETPALEELQKATAAMPVDIVGVDQQEDIATVSKFASHYGLSFPILLDDRHVSDHMLGVHYIPTTFIVDSRGIVLAHVEGALSLEQMEQLVNAALHGRTVADN